MVVAVVISVTTMHGLVVIRIGTGMVVIVVSVVTGITVRCCCSA